MRIMACLGMAFWDARVKIPSCSISVLLKKEVYMGHILVWGVVHSILQVLDIYKLTSSMGLLEGRTKEIKSLANERSTT